MTSLRLLQWSIECWINLVLLMLLHWGAMIETPAALFALDEILDIADFIAIGYKRLDPATACRWE